jgi:hypothetical protein
METNEDMVVSPFEPAFTVIPRCSPPCLVRLWCGGGLQRATGAASMTSAQTRSLHVALDTEACGDGVVEEARLSDSYRLVGPPICDTEPLV